MPRKPKNIDKLDALKARMGKEADHTIAEEAEVSSAAVGRYRRKHGIGAYDGFKFGARGEGTAPAKRTGKAKRTAKAKPAAKAKGVTRAKPSAKALAAAKVLEGKLAPVRVLSANPKKTRGKRGPDKAPRKSKIGPYRDMVGKVRDQQIAARAGVTVEAVRMYRRRHGISLLVPGKPGRKPKKVATPRRRISKLDPYVDIIGVIPDADVAKRANVTSENVRAFRKRHNIEAGWRAQRLAGPRASSAPRAKASRPVPVVSGSQGFSVSVSGMDQDYVVVATDIVAAVAQAVAIVGKRHRGASISAVRHLGPAL
jgi:hypothetical protein